MNRRVTVINRLWDLWAIRSEGTDWTSWISALSRVLAWNFTAQLTNGKIATAVYYNQNNWRFGINVESSVRASDSDKPFFDTHEKWTLKPGQFVK
jgi:hypothetical protein